MNTPDFLTAAYLRLRPRLTATARHILPGEDSDVTDALQEAFCRLWGHRRNISSASHAEGALMTAVRNVCIDTLRRSHTEAVSDTELARMEQTSDSDSATNELYDEVSRIISSQLNERDREILLLRDRNGYEMDAIAARFGLSEANVRLILSRARRTVRECYRNKNLRP
ncbi:MAG: sigma-70 family RNA polymerase sigma factor [Muribaculaceae bacterium]|nr:sigma-70 family RNA polymerase sigma factor [Muribaculaceae bacterium]